MRKPSTMRSALVALAFVAGCPLAMADGATTQQVLVVVMSDGTEQAVSLDDKPVVSFTDEGVSVSSPDLATVFVEGQYGTVSRFYFREGEPTAIEKAAQRQFAYACRDGVLTADGVPDKCRVAAYTTDGIAANADIARDGDHVVVDLRRQPSGIYIIRIDKQTFKVTKR